MSTDIKILGTHIVRPTGPQAHDGPLHLTAWDQIFGDLQAKTVHFYKPDSNPHHDWAAKLENLKDSLSRALAQFSPFAGRLRWKDGGRHRLEIVCNGEGAEVVEAECDGEMSWFGGGAAKRLVAGDGRAVEERALLAVQVTKFGCGGVAVGICTAHAVVDGRSAFHFFEEWARLARGEPMKEVPYLDRTIFKLEERRCVGLSFSDHVEFRSQPLLLGKHDSVEEGKKRTVKVVFPLTKDQVNALKKFANSSTSKKGHGVVCGFSRYEVIAAHIWRCASKARGHQYEQPTTMSIAVDVRNRLHTFPVPQRYFGNTVLIMKAMSRAGDLMSSPLGFACEKIREALNKVDEDYIWSNIDLLEKQEDLSFYRQDTRESNNVKRKPFYGNPNLRVTSWLTLPIHGMDFGWGNTINMVPIARDLDGSSLLLPSAKNDGSIDVVLCLQEAHMDTFKKQFYQDIPN